MSAYIMRSTDDSSIEVVRPDNSSFRLIEVTDELNALLARAESAEKMADHWETKAKESRKIDWNRARIDAAISAMHAILSQKNYSALLQLSHKSACDAKAALDYADELIVHLSEDME